MYRVLKKLSLSFSVFVTHCTIVGPVSFILIESSSGANGPRTKRQNVGRAEGTRETSGRAEREGETDSRTEGERQNGTRNEGQDVSGT